MQIKLKFNVCIRHGKPNKLNILYKLLFFTNVGEIDLQKYINRMSVNFKCL